MGVHGRRERRADRCAAGHQIRLSDPAWPDGSIRIQLRQGGYLVTNDLPHPVYLDGEPLAPAASRNLYHGAALQPTRGTLLRLGIVAAPAGVAPAAGVIATPPPVERRSNAGGRVLCAAVLTVACGFYWHALAFAAPLDGPAAERHKDVLLELERDPKTDPALIPAVRRARHELGRAVYEDAAARAPAAHARYRQALDDLGHVRRGLPDGAARQELERVEEFANTRLTATSAR